MQLLDLGLIPWQDTQLVYHALCHLGREALVLVSPATPYVSIGYHQDLDQEVDVDRCAQMGLPLFRREVGGGAVYLDSGQLFYHVVIRKDGPLAAGTTSDVFARVLRAPVAALGDLGIGAVHRPVNDIVVASSRRKISGNGAADIGDMTVIVGSLISTFDFDAMVAVLKVPSEKFRDKVHKTMRDNLTTLESELGRAPPRERVHAALSRRFEEVLGALEVARGIDPELRSEMDRLWRRYSGDDWLRKRGRRSAARRLKVREGVELVSGAWKAPGGLVRADATVRDGRLEGVELTGDFFIFPHEALEELESALGGAEMVRAAVERAAATVLGRPDVEALGVGAQDVASALLGPPPQA